MTAAKMMTGKILESTEPSGRNHSLSQHTAAGMTYIDPQTCHKGIDFLRYLEKADGTHEPNQDIPGYCFFAHSIHLSLYFLLRNRKGRLRE